MTKPSEVVLDTADDTLVAELARAHDTETLIFALRCRLSHDGHNGLSSLIMHAEDHETKRSACASVSVAQVLTARLRAEGRGEVADALASLLGEACIDLDSTLHLPQGDGWIAEKERLTAKMRE